jgi:zinc finger protein
MSFECEACGNKNNEVQFGGKIADQGVHYQLKVDCTQVQTNSALIALQDLNRECIKSEHATIKIPELEFEIPSNKKASVNTIEGFINNS